MTAGTDPSTWIAVALDDRGRILGALPIRGVRGDQTSKLQDSLRLEDSQCLVTVKRQSLMVTPLSGSKKKRSSGPTKSLANWKAPDFHQHFQERYRKIYELGYPALSHKDRENWKSLLGGFSNEELVTIIDFFIDSYHSVLVKEISNLPTQGPTVGILRGWMTSIAPLCMGSTKHATKRSTVREWDRKPSSGGLKF